MAVIRTWMRSVALAAVTVAGTAVPATSPAHAHSPARVQCQGTESVAYRPGVTFAERDIKVTAKGRFGSCVDSAGEVTSGSYGEQFTISAGCNDLLDGFEDRRIVKWSTGDASVIQVTGTSTAVAGQVVTTITGTVAQGRFRGRNALQTVILPQAGVPQCLTTGFTGATGVTTLTIT
ncbi:hypothetical protein [Streptomyces sp. NPDC046261]|uniref:hypothetical protein n=1 Tax=Streptomyces sp. NPDC046261 TaxID=3157200 RepID=UPI00340A24F1